jgi:CreA protein
VSIGTPPLWRTGTTCVVDNSVLSIEPVNGSAHMEAMRTSVTLPALLALALLGACSGEGERVGDFSNDWTGNEMVVTAIRDPRLPQVLCHFTNFDRSFLDRIGNGNWFENPSNSAIACHATAPIPEATLASLPRSAEVFSRNASLLFKSIAVRRIVDLPNRSIVYVSYAREIAGASAKMDMSVVALEPAPPVPAAAAPQ